MTQGMIPSSAEITLPGESSLFSCVMSTTRGIAGSESPSSTNLERSNGSRASLPPLNLPSTWPRCTKYFQGPMRVSSVQRCGIHTITSAIALANSNSLSSMPEPWASRPCTFDIKRNKRRTIEKSFNIQVVDEFTHAGRRTMNERRDKRKLLPSKRGLAKVHYI